MILTDRQLCLLSNSALELKDVLERVVSQQMTTKELMAALAVLEDATNCIRLEVQHGFEITDVDTNLVS